MVPCRRFWAPKPRSTPGMAETFDLVILGGGCAGLSLSMALAAQGRACPRTLVIESRTEYANDRTWCYWADPAGPENFPVQQRWRTMRVVHAGQSVSVDCGSTPYHMLTAQDFYATALASIGRQPNIGLKRGTAVIGEPSHASGVWQIRTTSGDLAARSVVDTRPAHLPRLHGATLWQSFYGQEIECSAAVFDPLSMDLMNFLAPNRQDLRFSYLLPVTPTRALVEVTVFGAAPLAPRMLCAQLEAAVAQRVGSASFTVLRHEHGILPMGLNASPKLTHKSWAKAGLMAGGARPSTGYAFQRIQRWAGECARALVTAGHPIGHRPDPLPVRLMDRIFLDVLRADPGRGAALFFSLFGSTNPARVIRFLSGNGGIIDGLAVVKAMPIAPFLGAAFAMARRRGRPGETGSVA